MTETKTPDSVEDNVQPPELVPIALIALEVGEPIDALVGRFAGHIELNDWGCRCVPQVVAMEHLARQWEWRKKHAAEVRRHAEELAAKTAPVPAGVPAKEGLSALETVMAAPDYQSPHDEFGPARPNWIATQLDGDAHRRAEEEQAQAKERAVDQMKERLG